MIFILFNVVIMLNFIIAILAKTYEIYDEVSNGLYYDCLINVFPLYEYDEIWGFVTCTHVPFNFALLL